ncbi:hypothetical protein BGX26_010525 [Mortierella sp. AD094]|nr:hypothetical protein BGX26_010525 [Mortierella sp. AD094]
MEKLQQLETATTPLIHSASTWVNNKKTKLSPSTFNDPLQTTHFDSTSDHSTPQVNNSSSTSSNKHIINNVLTHSDSQSRHSTNSQISVGSHSFADPLQQNLNLEHHHHQQQQQVMTHPLSFSKANHSIGHMLEDDINPGETKGDDDVVHEQQLSAKSETYATTGHTIDASSGVLEVVRNNPNYDESKQGDSEGQLTTAKISSSLSITSMATTTTTITTAITATAIATESTVADNENRHSVTTITTERAVRNLTSADPLSPLVNDNDDQRPARQAQRRPLRPRTLSSPVQSRVKPLEHLTNMGPLELEREIDSGVHLSTESSPTSTAPIVPQDFASVNLIVGAVIDNSIQQLQRLSLHPSTSTLVSEASRSSSTTTRRTDQDTEAEGMVWSGAHPLLMDYTAEPELLEDSSDYNFTAEKSRLNMRAKGHSMSVDVRQSSIRHQDANTDAFASGPSARRRRNVSKANEDRSWTSRGDEDLGHGRTTAETTGKRVIIHQVTPTDTLAGIALYYGIQVPILKKSNKLWTNDSIHTRKYLYIPFEECTVARQAGVMVDENNQTVFLPQRIQHHSRSGSAISPSFFASSRMSTYDATIEPINNNLPTQQQTSNLQAIMESTTGLGPRSRLGTELTSDNLMAISPPFISAVAAGMLPSTPSPLTSSPSRMGTWIDAKSLAAPPLPSPTITTTTSKSDNSLKASSLSPPRQNATDSLKSGGSATGLVPFSEDLPDTVVVPPSMTHEALAARFKEMDIISSEQQQRKLLGQEQELRINPVHQRHRTTDLRQFANVQQILDSGKRSLPTSNAGSRRASVDVGAHESTVNSAAAGPLSRRGPVLDSGDSRTAIEEEDEEEHIGAQNKQRQGQDSNGFIAYGHHQHIYATDDLSARGDYGGTSDRSLDANELGEDTATLRRQEIVTLPAGMLSFFPSSEHSKKLETPQSISRIQNQTEGYHHSASSLSSLSSSGSFRGTLSPRDSSNTGVRGTRTKGRAALNDQTFRSPRMPSSSSSVTHSEAPTSQRQQSAPSSSSDTIHSRTNSSSNSRTSAYSKAVRINQQQYFTPQKWSAMGESLVDDLLGAVRGPLQIARRVYNFTTLGFGAAMGSNGSGSGGGSSSKDSLDFDSSSSGSVRRRTSTRSRSGRGQRNKEFRHSGSAIELDQAIFLGSNSNNSSTITTTSTTATATSTISIGGIETNVTRRVPTSLPVTVTAAAAADTTSPESSNHHSTRGSRRKSSSGHGHFSGSSSGGSTRKRSLRSSNPVNHAALMALVNELDKEDKREKEIEKEEKTIHSSASNNIVISPLSSAPIVDILATSF